MFFGNLIVNYTKSIKSQNIFSLLLFFLNFQLDQRHQIDQKITSKEKIFEYSHGQILSKQNNIKLKISIKLF